MCHYTAMRLIYHWRWGCE